MTLDDWLGRYDEQDWRTATEGTVRYALIGLGWWTSDVAIPAIEASTFCETTVLISSSRDKAERLADEHDVEHALTYDEYHDGELADEYDAVYIGTPNAFHLEYAETAASLGKGVLCEKPMEADVERATKMVEACQESDAPLMVAYRMQTEPAVRRARELLDAGFIGDPVYVYGNNSQPLLEMIPDPDQWRLNPDLTGYGTSVMDLGIYSINTARFLLDRDPQSVQAQLYSEHEAFEDVDDERASFMLDFGDGVQMVSTASQNGQQDTILRITGTEGQIELSPAFHGECQLHVKRGDLSVDVEHGEMDAVDEMEFEFDYFADRLLTGADIYPDGEHGLVDMQVVDAIHRAGETDGTVDIESR